MVRTGLSAGSPLTRQKATRAGQLMWPDVSLPWSRELLPKRRVTSPLSGRVLHVTGAAGYTSPVEGPALDRCGTDWRIWPFTTAVVRTGHYLRGPLITSCALELSSL